MSALRLSLNKTNDLSLLIQQEETELIFKLQRYAQIIHDEVPELNSGYSIQNACSTISTHFGCLHKISTYDQESVVNVHNLLIFHKKYSEDSVGSLIKGLKDMRNVSKKALDAANELFKLHSKYVDKILEITTPLVDGKKEIQAINELGNNHILNDPNVSKTLKTMITNDEDIDADVQELLAEDVQELLKDVLKEGAKNFGINNFVINDQNVIFDMKGKKYSVVLKVTEL